jgi:hypothetical protein
VEVKRAFRCYRGPDDPGPFSDMINSMSFGCRHMKEFNKNGVFCLSAHTPEGYVKVMRVGDVDYIWTEGGVKSLLYIILIPDTIKGYRIPVTIKEGDYTFGPIESFGLKPSISRYQFMPDIGGVTGASPCQQYMPYIFKYLGQSHASVGDPGGEIFFSPQDEWHRKFYVLDCTGEASAQERLWYPPGQGSGWAFGQDLLPTWYSMSPFTAHGFHWCFEAAIDQLKKTYIPYNTEVTLAAEGIVIPNFDILDSSGKKYNMQYPLLTNRFFGKNAYTYTTDLSGNKSISAIGEHIYVSGVVTPTKPEIDPVLFFWPWIPYLDEIRSFNILLYSSRFDLGDFEGFFMSPGLDTFHELSIGYYTPDGAFANQPLTEDEATFSDVTGISNTENTDAPTDCGCGLCGTGVWTINHSWTTNDFTSSGTKHIPIGLIGGKIPIIMKTSWVQTAKGPSGSSVNTATISGNYPFVSLTSGDGFGLVHWYETCCITNFANTHNRASSGSESASNEMTLSQELKVGDDIIFSGESSMDYSMSHSFQEAYDATIEATVIPPDAPECAGNINYTTSQMSVNQKQNLSWTDSTPANICGDAHVFSWALSGGGSLSSTTSQTTTYTAPSSNAGCSNNATISLLCDGVVVDEVEIAINQSGYTGVAYYYNTGCIEFCEQQEGEEYFNANYYMFQTQYHCDGSVHLATTKKNIRGISGGPWRSCPAILDALNTSWTHSCAAVYGVDCCAAYEAGLVFGYGSGYIDVRTQAQIDEGCCPAALL